MDSTDAAAAVVDAVVDDWESRWLQLRRGIDWQLQMSQLRLVLSQPQKRLSRHLLQP